MPLVFICIVNICANIPNGSPFGSQFLSKFPVISRSRSPIVPISQLFCNAYKILVPNTPPNTLDIKLNLPVSRSAVILSSSVGVLDKLRVASPSESSSFLSSYNLRNTGCTFKSFLISSLVSLVFMSKIRLKTSTNISAAYFSTPASVPGYLVMSRNLLSTFNAGAD